MKRLLPIILIILCCMAWTLPASAHSATQLRSETTVDADGSCAVTITATLVFDKAVDTPVFPVPLGAQDITLNGSAATTYSAASSRMISLKKLTGGNPGTHTLTIFYRLPGVVGAAEEKGGLLLTLQLLSGLPYPIDSFEATVTLPGEIDATPSFSSGYYQQNIDAMLRTAVTGSTITLKATEQLKDHETLTLSLPVDPAMFPSTARTVRVLSLMDLLVVVSVVLALGWFVLVMWPQLPQRRPRPAAPDGISPGELPQWFTGSRMDFSMLIITWAQLGYLRIQVTKSGHVKLHKRMEMGNERRQSENRCYRELFGRRRTLDCGSEHFAQQRRLAPKRFAPPSELYRTAPIVRTVFRGLCALSGLFCGIHMGGIFVPHASALQFFMGILTALLALGIQAIGSSLFLRRKSPALIGLGCAVLWIILGNRSGQALTAVLLVVFQLLAGFCLAFGGKRTELGLQALRQIGGLRKFIHTATKQELQQLLKSNPNYFHELAPYALSMGLDAAFARRFARLRMPDSPYLVQEGRNTLTAVEWAALMRTAARILDGRIKFRR
ncbi:MAG: DUF2207 domain-containing protein [Oscillospiraceae bacterium]|nr:DUF2207 domain-containing protein [Oscillospiraceae bacterium]